MTIEGMEITHTIDATGGEYVARLPEHESVGRLIWKSGGKNVRVAEHTLVPPEIGGRGVAAALVDAMVADAREQDFRIDPRCSYIAAKFDRNPDWADLRA